MNHTRLLINTARVGYDNVVGLAIMSVIVSLTIAPLGLALSFQRPLVIVSGLWAACLLWGIALLATFRFTGSVVERGVRVSVCSNLKTTLEKPETGLKLGVVTFGILVGALIGTAQAPSGLRSIVLGVVLFALISWYVIVGFAAPELGDGAPLVTALRAGMFRFASSPLSVAVFLVVSVLITVVTGMTLILVVFLLPGTLALWAVSVARYVEDDGSDPNTES